MNTHIKDLKSTQRARTLGNGAGDNPSISTSLSSGRESLGSEVPITSPSSAQAQAS